MFHHHLWESVLLFPRILQANVSIHVFSVLDMSPFEMISESLRHFSCRMLAEWGGRFWNTSKVLQFQVTSVKQDMLIVWGWPKPCSRVGKYSRWWQLKYFLMVIPIWGRFPFWGLHIFQMGWFNHQLVIYCYSSQYEANPQIHCNPLFRQGPNI